MLYITYTTTTIHDLSFCLDSLCPSHTRLLKCSKVSYLFLLEFPSYGKLHNSPVRRPDYRRPLSSLLYVTRTPSSYGSYKTLIVGPVTPISSHSLPFSSLNSNLSTPLTPLVYHWEWPVVFQKPKMRLTLRFSYLPITWSCIMTLQRYKKCIKNLHNRWNYLILFHVIQFEG